MVLIMIELNHTNLNKGQLKVASKIDDHINYFFKAKGTRPELIRLYKEDFEKITSNLKSDDNDIRYKGVKILG